jgi:predicted nucleic acid-binding protein
MRVFLDAKILFSAAKSDGAIRRLLALLAEAGHECHADAYVVEETRRNLALKAPGNLPVLDRLLGGVHAAQVKAQPENTGVPGALAEKDRPVLAAAMQLGCEALVTGDRPHFGAFYGKTFGGVKIHSPRSLAEAVLKSY